MSSGLILSLIANAVLLIGLLVAVKALKRHREAHKGRGLFGPFPVNEIELDRFDPCFATDELGPDVTSETRFIAGYHVPEGISDRETWILANLAKTSERIFEFGTGTGKTTYLLAANAPASARVITLTLPRQGAARALFYYANTPEVANIEQLFGDSRDFDEKPYQEFCDLIFVDGSRDRAVVESDSRKALSMLTPGGIVLWHDYHGPRRARGVFKTLNALSRELPLVHLKGTSLVAYRKPLMV